MSDPRPSWKTMNDEQCAAFLRQQMGEGKSFGEMAAMFCDTTRNAILGKRHRLVAKGIALPPANPRGGYERPIAKAKTAARPASRSLPSQKVPAPKQVPVKAVKQPVAHAIVDAQKEEAVAISKSAAFLPIPGIAPIQIADLPNRLRCRWPVDVDHERHFACGAATLSDTHVYCAPHRRLAVRSAQPQGAN